MIHLSEADFKELKKLLNFVIPGKEVLAYGSRVSGQPRINSDFRDNPINATAPSSCTSFCG
jgi:hypothetical protein